MKAKVVRRVDIKVGLVELLAAHGPVLVPHAQIDEGFREVDNVGHRLVDVQVVVSVVVDAVLLRQAAHPLFLSHAEHPLVVVGAWLVEIGLLLLLLSHFDFLHFHILVQFQLSPNGTVAMRRFARIAAAAKKVAVASAGAHGVFIRTVLIVPPPTPWDNTTIARRTTTGMFSNYPAIVVAIVSAANFCALAGAARRKRAPGPRFRRAAGQTLSQEASSN